MYFHTVIMLTPEQSNYTLQESAGVAQVCVQFEIIREDTTVEVTLETTTYQQDNHAEATGRGSLYCIF